jgi:hypothetical protein
MCNTCTNACQCKPFTINKPGEYETRGGSKAVVLGKHKVTNIWIGYLANTTGTHEWVDNGERNSSRNYPFLDIVSEWKEPIVLDAWMNVYEDSFGKPCVSVAEAEVRAQGIATYIQTVHLRYTEGNGVEIIKD